MKKILLFLLLLLNLQIITDNGFINLRIGEVAAQSLKEEQLPGFECTGKATEECDLCHSQIDKRDLVDHKEYTCPDRTVTCDRCKSQHKACESCNCSDTKAGEYCPLCNNSFDICTCEFTVIGSRSQGGSSNNYGISINTSGNKSSDTTPIRTGGGRKVTPTNSTNSSTPVVNATAYAKVRINGIKITFDPDADHEVNIRLISYLEKVFAQAIKRGITSIQISSTTNHPSNKKKSAHSISNGAKAIDINYVNGIHVSASNKYASILQGIINNTSDFRENYGPFTTTKVINGAQTNMVIKGHDNHIHISIP